VNRDSVIDELAAAWADLACVLLNATADGAVATAKQRYRDLAGPLLEPLSEFNLLSVYESGQVAGSVFSDAVLALQANPVAKAEAIMRNQYLKELTFEYESGERVWEWPPSHEVVDDSVHLQVVLARQVERRREQLWMLDVGPHSLLDFVLSYLTLFTWTLLRGANQRELEEAGYSHDEIRQYSTFLELRVNP